MRLRVFVLSLVAVLAISATAMYIYTGPKPSKNGTASKRIASRPSGVLGFVKGTPIRKVGEEASSLAEAEARVGRKAKLPAAGLVGGDPIIRTGGDNERQLRLIYPNDLFVESYPSVWPPGTEPREFYANVVKSQNETLESAETANLPNRPADLNLKYELLEIAGNPGYGREKDYQLVDGKKAHPLPAYVIWAQDGIQYSVNGVEGMPLAKVIEIAESVAKSD